MTHINHWGEHDVVTETGPLPLVFTHPFTFAEAEEAAGKLAAEHPERRVTLSTCAIDVEPAAASVLTNALRRYAGANLLDIAPRCERSPEHCTCTSLVPALAAYQGKRTERDTIATTTPGFVLVPFIHRASAASVGEFIAFHHRFTAWLRDVLHTTVEVPWSTRQAITEIAYHAAQNIYDHAYRKPFTRNGPVFSYVAAQFRDQIPVNGVDAGVHDYMAHAPAASAYLILTVNDDGVGIAARHAQDDHIYWESAATEYDALLGALTAQVSVKLQASDTTIRGVPGLGTSKILHAVRTLRAYATLRTGRYLTTIDGTVDDTYRIDPTPRAYMPGTLVNVIIPLGTATHA